MNRRLKLLEKLKIFLVPVQVHSSKFFRLTVKSGQQRPEFESSRGGDRVDKIRARGVETDNLVRSRHGGGLGQPVLGNVDEEVLQALREVHQVVLVVGAGEAAVRAVGPLVRTVGGRLAGLGPGGG